MIPIIYENHIVSSNAVTVVRTPDVPPGFIFKCLGVYAYDQSSAIANSIKFAIASGEAFQPIDYYSGSFSAGVPAVRRYPVLLSPQQSIAAIFDIPSSGDLLHLIAHGVLLPICRE